MNLTDQVVHHTIQDLCEDGEPEDCGCIHENPEKNTHIITVDLGDLENHIRVAFEKADQRSVSQMWADQDQIKDLQCRAASAERAVLDLLAVEHDKYCKGCGVDLESRKTHIKQYFDMHIEKARTYLAQEAVQGG